MLNYLLFFNCRSFFFYKCFKVFFLSLLLSFSSFSINAAPIDIFQLSAFLNTPELGFESLQQDEHSSSPLFSEIQDAGLQINFNQHLNANNLGSFNWEIKNTLGIDLTHVKFFTLLDIEIDEAINTLFNEFGALINVSGVGTGDILPDSWEIDEPGFVFGDIYDNLLDGMLDNSNNVPDGQEDDVSLALGFEIGTLLAGETLNASFIISLSDIGGLSHTDPDSNLTFFFNGSAQVSPVIVLVSEPNTIILIALPLLLVLVKRFKG